MKTLQVPADLFLALVRDYKRTPIKDRTVEEMCVWLEAHGLE